jgi:hypothetical protein
VASESLQQAAKDSDPEVSRRASDLLTYFEDQIKSLKLLTPKKVNLKLSDVSVADAIKDLAKQSGYPIRLDDKAKAERKVSMETGEVPFWEAFDQLCQKAGLVEKESDDKGGFLLSDGTPQQLPTCYAGAVRLRLVPGSVKRKDGVTHLAFDVAIEPRLRDAAVKSATRIESALDDNGKSIDPANTAAEPADTHRAPAALKLDAELQALKELRGSLTLEAFTGDKVVIDNPAKSVGKSFELADGSTFTLDGYDKKDNGDVNMQGTVVRGFQPGGKVVIKGGLGEQPVLTDTKGNAFHITSNSMSSTFNGRSLTTKWNLTYSPKEKGAEVAQLSIRATEEKKSIVIVPFTFKHLKLK